MSYFTVPVDVIEDAEELVNWARRSVQIAKIRSAAKPRTRQARRY
jgi:TfoX/Sxy family transcriptional regulator of competence genes